MPFDQKLSKPFEIVEKRISEESLGMLLAVEAEAVHGQNTESLSTRIRRALNKRCVLSTTALAKDNVQSKPIFKNR